MRISDWSSDVCSSDLSSRRSRDGLFTIFPIRPALDDVPLLKRSARWVPLADPAVTMQRISGEEMVDPDGTLPLEAWMERQHAVSVRRMAASISAVDLVKRRPGFGQTIVPAPRSEERRVGKECVSPCR